MTRTVTLGQPLRRYPSVDSTNIIAAEWARTGAPHGAAVRADEQTRGRGRQGRAWNSPAGLGLYLSLILRPELDMDEARIPQWTMVAALAAARAIEELAGLDCHVKWPNDIVLRGRKIGGVLSEAGGNLARFRGDPEHGKSVPEFAVIGIGLNVNFARHDLPRDAKIPATSLLVETGRAWPIDDVANAWLHAMATLLHRHQMNGWNSLRDEWLRRDILMGQSVRVEGGIEADGAKSYRGVAEGINADGTLRVQTANGPRHVVAGDVRLEAWPESGTRDPEPKK